MKKRSKIIINAVKILGYLIDNNAMAGGGVKAQDIYNSVGLPEKEFDAADTYLLQQKYVDGTMGGMEGSRYLTGSGVEFYEENNTLVEDAQNKQEIDQMPDTKKVFVVHGRDVRLRNDFFSFLRALTLQPIEWSEALKLTGKATPYIGEALESAFKNAQAVIVLLTPDDEVRLAPELWTVKEDENEKTIKLQARPNVLFEAGMAFGTHPDRTLLIEVGQVKAFSDVAGRHVIRLSNSSETRNEIAERLRTAGCGVSTSGSQWLSTGDFTVARKNKAESFRDNYKHTDLNEGDILALLDDWWPKSKDAIPENVKVNFNELDTLLSLPPGSTKKHIGRIAASKSFKSGSCGDVFAIFQYDVTINDFGTYLEPDAEPTY